MNSANETAVRRLQDMQQWAKELAKDEFAVGQQLACTRYTVKPFEERRCPICGTFGCYGC